VRAGEIGTLRLIVASFSFSIDPKDWRLDPTRGGGALFDVGCYGVNAARYFTGEEPDGVRATARRGATGVDLTLAASLRFPSGAIAQVDCSFEAPYRCRLELVGTGGAIEVPDAFLPGRVPMARLMRLGTDSSADGAETLEFDGHNPYSAMVDHFGASVAAGRLIAPAEDGLAQMVVLDCIIHAME
jgi:predicted dehydrogenase